MKKGIRTVVFCSLVVSMMLGNVMVFADSDQVQEPTSENILYEYEDEIYYEQDEDINYNAAMVSLYRKAEEIAESRGNTLINMEEALDIFEEKSRGLEGRGYITENSLFKPITVVHYPNLFTEGKILQTAHFNCTSGTGEYDIYSLVGDEGYEYLETELYFKDTLLDSFVSSPEVNFDFGGFYKETNGSSQDMENMYRLRFSRSNTEERQITVTKNAHQESAFSQEGGSWIPDYSNGYPMGMASYINKVTYLNREQAQGYYIAVGNDWVKQVRDYVITLPFAEATQYLVTGLKISNKIAQYVLKFIEGAEFFFPSLTEMELISIMDAGNAYENQGRVTFRRGIRIISMTALSTIGMTTLNVYESNNYNNTLYGPALHRGYFDLTDTTPMWR